MNKRLKNQAQLASKLKSARKQAGLSQKELGEYIQVSDKAVSSYEVGRAIPSFETLRKISRATHKPISYFDQDSDPEDLDLQIRLKTIEKELLEIKQLLKKRQSKK